MPPYDEASRDVIVDRAIERYRTDPQFDVEPSRTRVEQISAAYREQPVSEVRPQRLKVAVAMLSAAAAIVLVAVFATQLFDGTSDATAGHEAGEQRREPLPTRSVVEVAENTRAEPLPPVADDRMSEADRKPPFSLRIAPAQQWAQRRTGQLVSFPARLGQSDLWTDLAGQIPEEWSQSWDASVDQLRKGVQPPVPDASRHRTSPETLTSSALRV